MAHLRLLPSTLVVLGSLGGLACSRAPDTDEIGATEFLSYIPGRSASEDLAGGDDGGMGSGGTTASGGTTGAPTDGGGGQGPERLIAEADLVQRHGDRLYALSQYSGLAVIDVSRPAELRVLGTYRASAVPFEMYVQDGIAHVLFNDFGRWVQEDGDWSYQTGARVQVLDLRDPAAITLLGEQLVPGAIADSRKVGEVLYLVTNEDGYCWSCDERASTRVSSFDVSAPDAFRLVDRVVLPDGSDSYSWGRSIAVTTERIYVADNSYSENWEPQGSLDVIDISDPGGDLVLGARVAVHGPIESRWQMDEYDGTLRVISQAGGWGSGQAPVLETFSVASADSVEPLASLTLVLPRPETLQSVRFDGERAFAVTFEQTDPLFTFDVSDPAEPRQLGELEIPGWIHHMEPRGDRLFTLGFDPSVEGSSLHASLYDVSDLTRPTQLSRVNFGGDWGNFAEDQDRIHKAFHIDLDAGLIAIPFSGHSYDEQSCVSNATSGIQLIDASTESLELRGVASQFGQARRALLLDDVLLGVSDYSVESFDISDRSAPRRLDGVELARNVGALRRVGAAVLRFGQDYWLGQSLLDFARIDEVERPDGFGSLDLSGFTEHTCASSSYWDEQVLVRGGYAYLPRRGYASDEDGKWLPVLDLFIVDMRDRSHPVLVGSKRLAKADSEALTRLVLAGDALLLGRQRGQYSFDPWTGERQEVEFGYDVYSLEDPSDPELVSHVELPARLAAGGFGYPMSGCTVDMGWGFWGGYYGGYYGNYGYYGNDVAAFVSGSIVASQHEEAVGDGSGRVRFYLDRLDVSDPRNPVLLPSVNIPGSIVHFEPTRLITVDYQLEEKAAEGWEDCQGHLNYFDAQRGTCRSYERRLNALELSDDVAMRTAITALDEESQWPRGLAASASHVFSMATDDSGRSTVRTFTWSKDGELERLEDTQVSGGGWSLVARDARAFVVDSGLLQIVDATGERPEIHGYSLGGYACQDLEVTEDRVLCAMGPYGVQSIELP